jgi:alkanesulfonate monooxygenase SsuD/methylene tetrahydromethanopterin reductase-like flavin-dependent oxidoreductase (luciferase family)
VAAARDPSVIRRLTGQVLRVLARGDPVDDASDIIGTPEFVTERLNNYRDARVDEFVVRDHAATPLADALESVTLLADEVVPVLG